MNIRKISYNSLDAALRAQKMFELKNQSTKSIMEGKFKQARKLNKEFAKLAIEDFETFTTLPTINISNVPIKDFLSIVWTSVKYRIYKAFTKKSPEEKLLIQKYKKYKKETSAEERNKNNININLPFYY